MATISGDIYTANVAATGGGGLGATGFNSSSLLIEGTRHGPGFTCAALHCRRVVWT